MCDRTHTRTHTWFFGSVPLMQLATNYERRMKVSVLRQLHRVGGRERERERALDGNSEREGEVLEHILDSHMPKLTHTHTSTLAHTYSKQSFSLAFAKPFLSSFLLSPALASFWRLFLRLLFAPFVFAFFLYFFHCVAVA